MELAIGWPFGVNCCDELVVEKGFQQRGRAKAPRAQLRPRVFPTSEAANLSLAFSGGTEQELRHDQEILCLIARLRFTSRPAADARMRKCLLPLAKSYELIELCENLK